jgi:hypothetical protein
MKAAAVETLKVAQLSPPVPQVSTTGKFSGTWIAFDRITLANPAISSTTRSLAELERRLATSSSDFH